MFLSELNDEMPILNGYNFYRPVIQIHIRKMTDIIKHLYDTNSLTIKLSIILISDSFQKLLRVGGMQSQLCPDFDEKIFFSKMIRFTGK